MISIPLFPPCPAGGRKRIYCRSSRYHRHSSGDGTHDPISTTRLPPSYDAFVAGRARRSPVGCHDTEGYDPNPREHHRHREAVARLDANASRPSRWLEFTSRLIRLGTRCLISTQSKKSEFIADAESRGGLIPSRLHRSQRRIICFLTEIRVSHFCTTDPIFGKCVFNTRTGSPTDMNLA